MNLNKIYINNYLYANKIEFEIFRCILKYTAKDGEEIYKGKVLASSRHVNKYVEIGKNSGYYDSCIEASKIPHQIIPLLFKV